MPETEISVVILTRGDTAMLETCLESLGPALDGIESAVAVVEHETDLSADICLRHPLVTTRLRLTDEAGRQSFSSLNNAGSSLWPSKYLLLLNNDVILQPETIKSMKRVLEAKKDVGLVGCKLLYPDGLIQHIGVVFDRMGVPNHLGWRQKDDGTFAPATRSDYYDAVTFACVLIRREVWEQVGGLDTDYFFNFEDADFCLHARELGWRIWCENSAMAFHIEGGSAEYRQSEDNSVERNRDVLLAKWVVTDRLEKIIGHPITRIMGPSEHALPKVAFVPADSNSGISVWRIMQPARMLSEKHLAWCEVLEPIAHTVERAQRVFDLADVVVWQAHFSESTKRMAQMGALRPWAMLYEYDDHPLYLSPYASCYQGLGTQEQQVTLEDGTKKWLWRDGENGFNLERNRINRQRQMEIISLSDGITTTTKPLVKFFERYCPNVWQLPNCIDFSVYKAVDGIFERKAGAPLRIGWWGGDNHWHDVSTIGKAITGFINRNEDARIVFLGAFYKGPFKGINLDRVYAENWVHAEAWPFRLAAAGLDIALVPLADPALPNMRFNHFKSEIKWLEAAALKVPCLVQAGRAAYENCVDGDTAMVYDGDEEFLEKLEQLQKDPDLRRKIGQRAYDWTREYRDLEKEAHRWAEVYETAMKMDRGKIEEVLPDREGASAAVAEGS